nr:immunoglobulin heavy chain junction region [Macaca mulatta]MOW77339.1 immunoglobulin heavy chain junction region [Macaca mulatta]MOW77686.1 immunoglobulin heavy chain junction region [Macaca mulatta]MOW77699.1 immunoglobulin heavy chain junction region [Macaca mulatta]MOW79281.1 immunoglobulin heavy chain junction region [Macaca mulatta]
CASGIAGKRILGGYW